MKNEFYLFRHGETDWNKQGRMQGSADVPLNSTGIMQAEALREFFDTQRVSGFSLELDLVSSDLQRAIQTAAIAFRIETIGPVRRDPRFRETNLGQAEGLTRDEVVKYFGFEMWSRWLSTCEDSWFARFPGGESKAEVRDRAQAAIFALSKEEARHQGHIVRRMAIATHGGLIRRLLHSLSPDEAAPIEVVNGSVFRFTVENGHLSCDREPVFKPL
jgi:probable phosphoglycerate mutase